MQKYATFNFACQYLSFKHRFVVYLAIFWTVEKNMQTHINPGNNH